MDEAIQAALATDNFFRLEEQRSGRRHRQSRSVDVDPMATISEIWKELKRIEGTFRSRNHPIDGLLGLDFLIPNEATLDFKTKELRIRGARIKCTDGRGGAFCSRVVVGSNVSVPPGQEVVLPGHATGVPIGMGLALIEPAEDGELLHKGIAVARVVVGTGKATLPVRVFNPGTKACMIRKGTLAGHLSLISEEDIEECESNAQPMAGTYEVPEHLKDLFERSKEGTDKVYHGKIAKLLCENQDIFAKSDADIGKTCLVKHQINTGNSPPIRERPRRFPPKEQEEIDRQIKDMLANGRIEPSSSPWASNVVLVKKKDGSKRFCARLSQVKQLDDQGWIPDSPH
nr:uncharacterized protein LOC129263467 [Lytechinus pictus]